MNGLLRVVPRLDIKGPNVVKGIQFEGYRVLGTAEAMAETYYNDGADELIYQDCVASLYGRNIDLSILKKTAKRAFIPLTVAGGIRSIGDINDVLRSGADKVAINTYATANPSFLREAAKVFGSQCIVASLEVFRQKNGSCEVWVDYGREKTALNALAWAQQAVELGAGEIMLTSINNEGTGRGFDIDLIRKIATAVSVPVIACGGAGSVADCISAAQQSGASAISAASIFHYHYAKPVTAKDLSERYFMRAGKEIDTGNIDFAFAGYGGIKEIQVKPISIPELKAGLANSGIAVRGVSQKSGNRG